MANMRDQMAVNSATEPQTTIDADPGAYRDVLDMLQAEDDLEGALGIVAGALLAVLGFLVAQYSAAEAKVIITGAIERYFARLTQ